MKKRRKTTTDRGGSPHNASVGFNKGVDPWQHTQQMLTERVGEPQEL
jgi:hypothetical protein